MRLPLDYVATYSRDYPDDEDLEIDLVTIRWFGQPWPTAEYPAPICHPLIHVETLPFPTFCNYCSELLGDADSGVIIPGPDGPHYYGLRCWLMAQTLIQRLGAESIPRKSGDES